MQGDLAEQTKDQTKKHAKDHTTEYFGFIQRNTSLSSVDKHFDKAS